MPKYRLSTEVPWKNILKTLYWHLELKIDQAVYQREISKATPNPVAEKMDYELLQEALACYINLRAFLGYPYRAKIISKAEDALSQLDRLDR